MALNLKSACQYKLKKKIGSGAYGDVFRVEDKKSKENVVIKRLNDIHLDELSELLAISFINHPNVLSSQEILNNDACFGREKVGVVASLALGDANDTRIPININKMVHQLIGGLLALHHEGIMHLDIKPANILVYPNDKYVFADFGLCMFAPDVYHNVLSERLRVTSRYRAPEIKPVTKRNPYFSYNGKADVFALGMTMIETITHESPFRIKYEFVSRDDAFPIYKVDNSWKSLIADVNLLNVLSAMVELDEKKRKTIFEIVKMPYFKNAKFVNFTTLTPKNAKSSNNKWDFWDYWKVDKHMSIRALLRCIDLFYVLSSYIIEKKGQNFVVSFDNINEHTVNIAELLYSLADFAKSIENDLTYEDIRCSNFMLLFIKTFNGRLYQHIVTDISDREEDVLNVIAHSDNALLYNKHRMSIVVGGGGTKKKSKSDAVVTQITTYDDLFF